MSSDRLIIHAKHAKNSFSELRVVRERRKKARAPRNRRMSLLPSQTLLQIIDGFEKDYKSLEANAPSRVSAHKDGQASLNAISHCLAVPETVSLTRG